VAETARLESVFAVTGNVGSNPTLSAISTRPFSFILRKKLKKIRQRTFLYAILIFLIFFSSKRKTASLRKV